ncbi:MAG: hypothetical protein ACD_65C00227G0001, partial [uncultured bacterium]
MNKAPHSSCKSSSLNLNKNGL